MQYQITINRPIGEITEVPTTCDWEDLPIEGVPILGIGPDEVKMLEATLENLGTDMMTFGSSDDLYSVSYRSGPPTEEESPDPT